MGQVLRARGISQRFGHRVVLDDVDLDVPAGRSSDCSGRTARARRRSCASSSGCSRRTPARWSGGTPGDGRRPRSWGYMPQERGLYRDMRVLDLLVWIARLHGLDNRPATRARTSCSSSSISPTATRQDLEPVGRHGAARAARGGDGPRPGAPRARRALRRPRSGRGAFLSDVITEHTRDGGNLLFSSHQLDLVEDLCETITLLTTVASCSTATSRSRRRVPVAGCASTSRSSRPGSTRCGQIGRTRAARASASLPDADPGAVLDAIRAHARPTISGSKRRPSRSCSSRPPASTPTDLTRPLLTTTGRDTTRSSVRRRVGEQRRWVCAGSACAPPASS